MEIVLQADEQLFQMINGLDSGFLDQVLPFYRHKLFWIPLYVFFSAILMFNFSKHGIWALVFCFMTVGVSDAISSHLIKKTVKRERPCRNEDLRSSVKLLIRCGGGYSFTSSHATNHAAIGFFLIFILGGHMRTLKWFLSFWFLSIGFAQIYVGVHYPLDVIAGFIVGGIVALAMYKLFIYLHPQWIVPKELHPDS
jgi:membrane-associated phospholipid phosphatase